LLGPLECHDDIPKRSLKQECIEPSRNECSDWADVTLLRRLFHTQGAATGKLGCRQMTV